MFVSGAELLFDGQYHEVTRAYRARTGSPLCRSRSTRAATRKASVGLGDSDRRLFVGGLIFTSPEGANDFVLRRYRTRGHGDGDDADVEDDPEDD